LTGGGFGIGEGTGFGRGDATGKGRGDGEALSVGEGAGDGLAIGDGVGPSLEVCDGEGVTRTATGAAPGFVPNSAERIAAMAIKTIAPATRYPIAANLPFMGTLFGEPAHPEPPVDATAADATHVVPFHVQAPSAEIAEAHRWPSQNHRPSGERSPTGATSLPPSRIVS